MSKPQTIGTIYANAGSKLEKLSGQKWTTIETVLDTPNSIARAAGAYWQKHPRAVLRINGFISGVKVLDKAPTIERYSGLLRGDLVTAQRKTAQNVAGVEVEIMRLF